jgi:hypothetical protein
MRNAECGVVPIDPCSPLSSVAAKGLARAGFLECGKRGSDARFMVPIHVHEQVESLHEPTLR